MEKEFVPYDRALRMKMLGFNEFTRFHITMDNVLNTISESPFSMFQYNMEPNEEDTDSLVAAPTFSQAFRWFREKYNLICRVDVTSYGCTLDKQEFYCEITSKNGTASYEIFNTYEEAELDCLKKLIEIVKEK